MSQHPDRRSRSSQTQPHTLSRRDFLKATGTVISGLTLASCGTPPPATTEPSPTSAPTPTPTSTAVPPSATPTSVPTGMPTSTAIPPTLTATPASTPVPASPTATVAKAALPYQVAIARAVSYDPKLVRRQVQAVFDNLGGLHDVVKRGDKVAIKVNLTGGTSAQPPDGLPAIETYVTHPAVVRAMTELLRDAGAKEVYIVEAVYEWASYQEWGYVDVANELGATLINLNDAQPYPDYASLPVGKNWFIYDKFTTNHILEEVDALVSVAKMKCHWICGVTQSMKNLVGMVPVQLYGDTYRSDLHGSEDEMKQRLPRVVVDLNRARPVNVSLIDGIKTVDGSEGPWNNNLGPQSPGILIGGKNPVATDAVAVAAMGFDPTAEYPDPPFLRAENHLNLAHQMGLGSNHLDDITIMGTALADVKQQFQPAYAPAGMRHGLLRMGA
jgi:uncharacterized protein (DUF362 family)